MVNMSDISNVVRAAGITVYDGYAPTNAKVPYVVNRPLIIDHENVALNGAALDWDNQFALYAAGGSVEASFNLAKDVIIAAQGKRVAGSTLDTSMGYVGAAVEGHYESQITIQLGTGGIS
ncbi:tail terminator [Microbacterium phage Pocket]|uniref:Tail terminator n=12 Tax=Ilzatvirus ilzat TaxID=2560593 RepID=A0A5J6TNJ9_9CAUD|nr:tail terminator [Microbacterium phage Aubergine]AUX82786.1 tail terminator [Microbacterium phage Espinosa]AUX82911.1 tail terminator [Microbacterium phage Kale]AUX83414.1 tail terminator [Microbacterium phage Tenda]AVJ49214.1 tail terminator [Microbacterium phage Bonino]AWN03790.1 tail terminator [Microbacterium phage Oats]QFG09808.1 tail terminator [Microbacterium phage Pocket]QFG11908.1 tail terminator [Microbacterium phage ManRay]